MLFTLLGVRCQGCPSNKLFYEPISVNKTITCTRTQIRILKKKIRLAHFSHVQIHSPLPHFDCLVIQNLHRVFIPPHLVSFFFYYYFIVTFCDETRRIKNPSLPLLILHPWPSGSVMLLPSEACFSQGWHFADHPQRRASFSWTSFACLISEPLGVKSPQKNIHGLP